MNSRSMLQICTRGAQQICGVLIPFLLNIETRAGFLHSHVGHVQSHAFNFSAEIRAAHEDKSRFQD